MLHINGKLSTLKEIRLSTRKKIIQGCSPTVMSNEAEPTVTHTRTRSAYTQWLVELLIYFQPVYIGLCQFSRYGYKLLISFTQLQQGCSNLGNYCLTSEV